MDRSLRQLDRRAELMLAALAPLQVERARPDEIEATERMRYACAVEMGWVPPAEIVDGRERDEDDARAIVLVCRDGAQIAGCMRVVPPAPGRLLPTERDFGVRASPPGSAADVGRLVVAPDRRGAGGPLVMAGCTRGPGSRCARSGYGACWPPRRRRSSSCTAPSAWTSPSSARPGSTGARR
jgi:hypothetical protein